MNSPGHSEHCRCCTCSNTLVDGRTPLIHLCDVTFMREKRTILSDINLTVDKGDFVAITGPNGGGKTTLLRLILGLLKPTDGKIIFCDDAGNNSMPPSIGYLPQKNSIDSHFPITVHEVVSSGLLGLKGIDKTASNERVAQLLDMVGLWHGGPSCWYSMSPFHISIKNLRKGSTILLRKYRMTLPYSW